MSRAAFEWMYCNRCGKQMRHTIVAESVRTRSEGLVDIFRTSQILECGGCEYTVLRKLVHFSEFQERPGDMDPDPEISPAPASHREPVWTDELNNYTLRAVLREVYLSLNVGLRFLAAVGMRTALDVLINEKVGDVGTFEQKLEKMVGAGFVSPEEKDRLGVLAEVGHAAAHRGYAPEPQVLDVVLKIIESAVERLYIEVIRSTELSGAADQIRPTIPRRKDR